MQYSCIELCIKLYGAILASSWVSVELDVESIKLFLFLENLSIKMY